MPKIAKILTDYDNKESIGSRLRRKRLANLMPLINQAFERYGAVKILDVGGTRQYWNIIDPSILESKKIHITLSNLHGEIIPDDENKFSYIEADGCNLDMFDDNYFHILHSNSVVEHVGDWHRMVQFAKEIKRVSRSYFVQTPNYWFPIEPHCMTPFFHWLPKPMRIQLVLYFSLGNWKRADSISSACYIVDSARLLNKKMLAELFKDAHIKAEKIFGFTKSYMAIKSLSA